MAKKDKTTTIKSALLSEFPASGGFAGFGTVKPITGSVYTIPLTPYPPSSTPPSTPFFPATSSPPPSVPTPNINAEAMRNLERIAIALEAIVERFC